MKRISGLFLFCVWVMAAGCGGSGGAGGAGGGTGGSGGGNPGGGGSGAATHFSVVAPATAVAGTAISFTVTALDAGNIAATSYSGTVRFTSSDSAAVLPADSALNLGGGTFNATFETGGVQTLTVTDAMAATIRGVSNAIQTAATVGEFVATGNMTVAREGHTATRLPNGKVLVTGGQNATGVLASAEIFDPATGMFNATGNMGTARVGHTATLLKDGTVFITGGSADAGAEIFTPASGMFAPLKAIMETVRVGHTATLLNDGRVLVAGGGDSTGGPFQQGSGQSSASAEIFDPATQKFSSVANDMLTGRINHTATLLSDGTVLLAGGSETVLTSVSFADVFSPTTNSFSATAGEGTPAFFLAAAPLQNGSVLLAGGEAVTGITCPLGATPSSIARAVLFDNASMAFSVTGEMTASRTRHTATTLPDGTVLVAGGASGVTFCRGGLPATTFVSRSSAELFNPGSGMFAPNGSMTVARFGHTATLLKNGNVLLAGGADENGNTLASAELFR
jgi:hypothetical protein